MKKTAAVLIIISTLFACNNLNKKSMVASDNEKLVTQYFEHFNNHEWTKMTAMYLDTAEFKYPSLGQGIVKQTTQQTAQS